MKRLFTAVIICAIMLSGCGKGADNENNIMPQGGIRYELNNITKNEGEISANDAIVIISANIAPESEYDIKKETLIYRAEGRETVENTECYIISFGPKKGEEFEVRNRYAVDVKGTAVFENTEGESWKKVYDKPVQ